MLSSELCVLWEYVKEFKKKKKIFYTFSEGLWDFQKVEVMAIYSEALNLGKSLYLKIYEALGCIAKKSCEDSTDTQFYQ